MQLQTNSIFRFHLPKRFLNQETNFGLVLRALHDQTITRVPRLRRFVKSNHTPEALPIEIAEAIISRDTINPGFVMIGRHLTSLFIYLQKSILSKIEGRLAIPHEAKQISYDRLF